MTAERARRALIELFGFSETTSREFLVMETRHEKEALRLALEILADRREEK